MTKRLGLIFALATLLVAGDAAGRASDIEVRTLDGETVPLSRYFEPGKWTLVMMWTTYCGACRSQYPAVSAFHDKHRDTDAKVIGMSLDGFAESEKVRAYIADKPMTFESSIVDPDAIRAAYKVLTEESFTGTPTYLMFNPAGDLVAHVPGLIAVEDIERYIAENGD